MEFTFVAIGTDESGAIYAYHFETMTEAKLFAVESNSNQSLDMKFEVFPLIKTGVSEAIADLNEMKGV